MRRLFGLFCLVGVLAATAGLGNAYGADRSRTFPETGFTVTGRLLDFWEGNGALGVFGLPVSEERTERTAEGRPISRATHAYERTSPWGISNSLARVS